MTRPPSSRLAAVVVGLVLVGTACSSSEQPASSTAAGLTPEPNRSAPVSPDSSAVPSSSPAVSSSSDATATPSPAPSPTPTVITGAFEGARAYELAMRLVEEVGPRPAGSDADRRARDVVAGWLTAAGWQVEADPVDLPQGGQTANLVASVGARPDGPHLVVGGHLDTLGGPGANDNATGIGVIVGLAEELADEAASFDLPVVLVAFGAEEYQPSQPRQHHIGSETYAAAYGDDVVAMLAVDMVGHGDRTCICWFAAGPATLAERLDTIADGINPDRYYVASQPDWSDHGPFARRGIPAAFLWTGRDGVYHTPADTPDRVRRADMGRAGVLALAWIRDAATDETGA